MNCKDGDKRRQFLEKSHKELQSGYPVSEPKLKANLPEQETNATHSCII
jgi:hypothetical protein